MGDIRMPSNFGSRGPNTGALIQCVIGRYTQIHELWCWDINVILREVHPKSSVEILDGTIGEFVIKYPSENGWSNQIIGKISINGSVQFIGISQIWGNRLPYIFNL